MHEHTNEGTAGTPADVARFAAFMATHGMSLDTITYTLKQLVHERRTGKYRWRRATVMDKLQWDVFHWYYRKHRPHFSTFFLNSTARLQHNFWRNLEPEQFEIKPTADELAEGLKSGYHHPDGLLWARQPDRAHAVHEGKVPLRSLAPAVLEMLDVPQPDFMTWASFLHARPEPTAKVVPIAQAR